MKSVACLALLAMTVLFAGCRTAAPAPGSALAAGPLEPSPRLIVGRIVAVDATHGFAFVELASDAPAAGATDGAELTARTLDLRETAQLRASRQMRGRTLGTRIVRGQPGVGDEVVWLAP
jgi:hypothetical protein